MKKKFLIVFCLILFSNFCVFASNVDEYIFQAKTFFKQNQFSNSIDIYRKALKLKPDDLSANIGIVNAFLGRATYYYNSKHDYKKTASDLLSALYYLKYNLNLSNALDLHDGIVKTEKNLEEVLKLGKIKLTSNYALSLRKQGALEASVSAFAKMPGNKDAYLNLGEMYSLLGNIHKSSENYEKYLQINPNDLNAMFKLAVVSEKLENYHQASKLFNQILENENATNEMFNVLYQNYYKKLISDKENAQNYINLGAVCQKLGKNKEALNLYMKALSIEPGNQLAKVNLGSLYFQENNFSQAKKIFNEVLTKNPNNYKARLARAMCFEKTGNFKNAMEDYQKVLANDPKNVIAEEKLRTLKRKNLSPKEYLAQLEKEASQNPNDAQANYDLGFEFHKNKNLNQAIYYYRKSIELGINNEDAYINLSKAFLENGDFDKALSVIETGKKKYNTSSNIIKYYDEIKQSSLQNSIAEAAKALEGKNYALALNLYSKINPPTFESLYGIGSCYFEQENLQKAIEYYTLALNKDKNNTSALNALAICHYNLQDIKNAKMFLNKSLQVDPSDSQAKELLKSINENSKLVYLNKAIDFYEKKQFSKALPLLNSVISSSPSFEAYYYRAMVFDEMKKFSQAIKDYHAALNLNPYFALGYYLLALDFENLNNTSEAKKAFQNYLEKETDSNNSQFIEYAKQRMQNLN